MWADVRLLYCALACFHLTLAADNDIDIRRRSKNIVGAVTNHHHHHVVAGKNNNNIKEDEK